MGSECNGCQSSRGSGQMLTGRKKDECKDNRALHIGMFEHHSDKTSSHLNITGDQFS